MRQGLLSFITRLLHGARGGRKPAPANGEAPQGAPPSPATGAVKGLSWKLNPNKAPPPPHHLLGLWIRQTLHLSITGNQPACTTEGSDGAVARAASVAAFQSSCCCSTGAHLGSCLASASWRSPWQLGIALAGCSQRLRHRERDPCLHQLLPGAGCSAEPLLCPCPGCLTSGRSTGEAFLPPPSIPRPYVSPC